jgi:hypothetical protein
MAIQLPFGGGADSGTYTPADVQRRRRLAEALMADNTQAREPFGALAKALTGARAGYEGTQAREAEEEGITQANQSLAEMLSNPNVTVDQLIGENGMGNPWANSQQQAILAQLVGEKIKPPAPYEPDYQTFNTPEGDVMRFDNNAADAQPSMLFDAPAPSPEFRTLNPEEVGAMGLPPGSYQQSRDGKISSIGSGPLVQVNTGEGSDGALDKALSTKEGELWSTYKQAGTVSSSNAQDFGVLDELIKIAPQGPIVGPLAETFKGFSSSADAFQSIVKRIAPTLRAPGSGATSDIEYQGMLDSLPSLKNAPEGNAMILSIMKAKAQINMERAKLITAYQNGEISIGDARRQMNELDSMSIITPEMRQAMMGIGANETPDDAQLPKVGEVVDGYEYQGGDPASPKSWKKR